MYSLTCFRLHELISESELNTWMTEDIQTDEQTDRTNERTDERNSVLGDAVLIFVFVKITQNTEVNVSVLK